MHNFFAIKQKIPAGNVIELYDEEATSQNLQKAVQKIAGEADANSLVYVYLNGHGGDGYIKLADRRTPYVEIDGWLDKINAGLVIVNPDSCKSGSAIEPMKEGPCPRIVITLTDAEKTEGGCVTYTIVYLAGYDVEERRQHFDNPESFEGDFFGIRGYDRDNDGRFSLEEVRPYIIYQNPDSQMSDPQNLAKDIHFGDYRVYRMEDILYEYQK